MMTHILLIEDDQEISSGDSGLCYWDHKLSALVQLGTVERTD